MSKHVKDALEDAKMLTALVRLRGSLQAAPLPLDLADAAALRGVRQELIDQLEDYVIPRLMSLEAPLLTVVGGSTGAGKSTLVNSLVGHRVTNPGVLRPTTRSPVLVHHPDDERWFGPDRLLPDLKRVHHATDDPDSIQLVGTDAVPPGLAILDAPDVDSVEERNRVLAGQLLAAADLWLFVTSAARYSDQVPWEYLKQAADRSTAVAIVLDRTPAESVQTVSTHLARMLAARGLKDSPLFGVAEGDVDDHGLLPPGHVKEIRAWLDALAEDAGARQSIVHQTVEGAIRTLTRRVYPIADAVTEQVTAVSDLLALADKEYDAAGRDLAASVENGALLRGDLLARWRDFIGNGELIRSLEAKVGFMRDRLLNAIKGKPQQAERVGVAIETAVEALVVQRAERAAEATAAAWSTTEHGAPLVDAAGPGAELARASRDLRRRTDAEIRAWHDEVVEIVRDASAEVRSTARFLAFGVRGLAVTLAVVALAGDETDEESAVLGRRVLDTVLDPATTSRIVDEARTSLLRRIDALLAAERSRYLAPADQWELTPEASDQLRQAARRVDDLRFAAVKRSGSGGHV